MIKVMMIQWRVCCQSNHFRMSSHKVGFTFAWEPSFTDSLGSAQVGALVVLQLRCSQLHFPGKRAAGARRGSYYLASFLSFFLRSSTRMLQAQHPAAQRTDPTKSFPFLSVRSGTGLSACRNHSLRVSRRNTLHICQYDICTHTHSYPCKSRTIHKFLKVQLYGNM